MGSLLGSHPLMYYLGREFFSGGEPHRFAAWEKRAEAPSFRAALRTITLVWGIVSVLEAFLRVGLVFVVAPSLMAFLSPAVAVATTLLLIAWSVWYFAYLGAGQAQ